MTSEIKAIHTDSEYDATLAQLEELLDAPEGTPEAARAEVLAILVEAYEAEHYLILPADPVDVIEFYMDQNNLTRTDLGAVLNSRPRATEILNRTRGVPLSAARALSKAWDLPLEILIGKSAPRQTPRRARSAPHKARHRAAHPHV